MIPFKDIQFGQASAELEGSYYPELLLDGFFDPWDVVNKVLKGPACIFLGYKGAGKSSIGEHLRLLSESDEALFVDHTFLSDFPYANFSKIVSGEAEPESRFPTAWSWIITLSLLASFSRDEGAESVIDNDFVSSIHALKEVGLLPARGIKEVVIASSKPKFKAKLPILLEMEWDSNNKKANDLDFLHVIEHLKNVMLNFRSNSRHALIIDGLDDILLQKEIQYQSIAALVLEVTRLNALLHKNNVSAKIVLLCRTELFERLPGPNKNKFRQDLSVELDWYHNPHTPESSNLVHLAKNRATLSDPDIKDVFLQLLPKTINNKPLLQFLIMHTRHTPRDFIQLLSHIQKCSTRRDVDEKNIFAGIKSYASKYFMPEIKDELVGYIDQDKVDSIFSALATIKKRKFSISDVSQCLSNSGNLKGEDLHSILDTLFNCSAIGNVASNGELEHFSFKYRNRHAFFKTDEKIILHTGLKKAMNIIWS
jgi:hypothetical protein